MMFNVNQFSGRDFCRVGALCAIALLLIAGETALAQCSGGRGRGGSMGAAAGGGLTAFGGGANVGQVQQMAAFAQQQAMMQQQLRIAALQQQRVLATFGQRQAAQAPVTFATPLRAPRPNLFVESAQRRREAYLRTRQERGSSGQSVLVALNN